ncbi:hypothetical protein N658DRAFT_418765 [Parathielavia hyrcaniae]|uniref:FAD-binding FR-type domain-containing protein n=1 Tax=Parathielavia hyrcaniae TaxID=113614 RepID=A0AAN6Q748_9PEZI|nr:hypothetical protein N658DRAFT_418765 [Parathielavia hyrcaniae]
MRQTFIHLHSRSPTTSATASRCLNSVQNASLSLRASCQPSSPLHRFPHRAFHITIPNNRRPPPTKETKPRFRFDSNSSILYQAPKNGKPRQNRQPPPPHPQPLLNEYQKGKPSSRPNPLQTPPTPRHKKQTWSIKAAALVVLTTAALALASDAILSTAGQSSSSPKPLNKDTFVPFTITAREQVSPTAFLLTLEPAGSTAGSVGAHVIQRAWDHGLWSVEVKQPELQVARDYTPLPPSSTPVPSEGLSEGDGKLRLYIRRMEKGEVSGYLARLGVGDTVELRGPRLGLDVRRRVGVDEDGDGALRKEKKEKRQKKKVVFFAGGTGIAPALQAARALLDHPGVEMEVVWANRRREDCVGCGGGEQKGPVVAMMEELRRRYGERFRYSCTVDEEGSFIDAGTVARLAQASTSAPAPALRGSTWGLWSSTGGRNSTEVSAPATAVNTDDCSYHSAQKLVLSDDRDTPAGADGQSCQCKDNDGNPVKGGKNLLVFSGPDGFMAHYVGAKVWAGGKELQGPVKGVVGDLKQKYPSLGEDRLILKM